MGERPSEASRTTCILNRRLGFVSRFISAMGHLRSEEAIAILSTGGRLFRGWLWMWRLYHATKDGRLFNYLVHLSSENPSLGTDDKRCPISSSMLSLKPRTSPLSSATIREATSSCAGRVTRPDDPFSQRESFVYESCNVCFVIFDLPREQSSVPKASST